MLTTPTTMSLRLGHVQTLCFVKQLGGFPLQYIGMDVWMYLCMYQCMNALSEDEKGLCFLLV
jgi:hypothetical protein